MASLAGRDSKGRRMGRRVALMRLSSMESHRRGSVRIWLRATRPDWVARKNFSLFSITLVAEEKAAAMAVRRTEVIASEIRISGREIARRADDARGARWRI